MPFNRENGRINIINTVEEDDESLSFSTKAKTASWGFMGNSRERILTVWNENYMELLQRLLNGKNLCRL